MMKKIISGSPDYISFERQDRNTHEKAEVS